MVWGFINFHRKHCHEDGWFSFFIYRMLNAAIASPQAGRSGLLTYCRNTKPSGTSRAPYPSSRAPKQARSRLLTVEKKHTKPSGTRHAHQQSSRGAAATK